VAGGDGRLGVRLIGRDEVHRVMGVEVDEHAPRLYAAATGVATGRLAMRA
jgi:hypothetical protein